MNSYADASNIFNSSLNVNEYFESVAASYVKSNLIRVIDSNEAPLIFLLGEPGVGKTYMLNIIKEEYILKKRVLFSNDPFLSPEDLLHFLLKNRNLKNDIPIGKLKDMAIEAYSGQENIIILDEAQLLNENVLEYIRILSDTGYFNFLISMHSQEGREILKKKHFASREHIVMVLERLDVKDTLKYVHGQLFRNSMGEFAQMFKQKQINQIYNLSKGNFRVLKQLLKHTFSIMDYARNHGHKSYTTPTKCVITMSAIDLEIIDA